MGEVVDPNRLRGDDNSWKGGLVICGIPNCSNQATNKCPYLWSKTCILEFVPSRIFKNNNLPFYTRYIQKLKRT